MVIYWYFIYSSVFLFGEGDGTPLQYSCLENPMDGGAWWAAVHGVAKSRTQLRDFTFTFPFHALEKEMATHSSVLAWRIPGLGEPGGLPSMGSHRVGHDWSDLAAAATMLLLKCKNTKNKKKKEKKKELSWWTVKMRKTNANYMSQKMIWALFILYGSENDFIWWWKTSI